MDLINLGPAPLCWLLFPTVETVCFLSVFVQGMRVEGDM